MNPEKFIKNIAQLCQIVFFSLIFLMIPASIVCALPGDLDTDFGNNGIVLTEIPDQATARVILTQSDGKIIVGGTVTYQGSPINKDFAVVRYNTDGSVDSTFGNQGKVLTSVFSVDTAKVGVLQRDGKIIIGGEYNDRFILVRYNSNGSPDTSFGDGGKVSTAVSAVTAAQAQALVIQPDDKILIAGDNDSGNIYLVRYNADGTNDSSFGDNGKVTTRIVAEGNSGTSVALQSNGKILVGGSVSSNTTARDSAIFRYNSNGTLDTSFDNDGVAIYRLSNSHDDIRKIFVRPDGKILSVGSSVNGEQNIVNYAFGIYDENGTPDYSFGSNGFSILPQIRLTSIEDAMLQSDGKIVVAGIKTQDFGSSAWRCHIARFNADGSFDFTFGNGGKINLPIGDLSGCYSVAQQSDGKLLLAGLAIPFGRSKAQIALTRLQGGTGQIPTSAAITGRVVDDSSKRGIANAQVTLTGGGLNSPLKTRTNPFGYYRFSNLPVNAVYNLTFQTKKKGSPQTSISNLLLNGNEFAEDLVLFHYTSSLSEKN